MKNKTLVKFLFLVVIQATLSTTTLACTTWATIGSDSAIKVKASYQTGLIIAKNRDDDWSGLESLKVFHPKHGYEFLALAYNNNSSSHQYPYISAGTNNQGLVLVSNEAATTKSKYKNRESGETSTMEKILTTCKTVDDVIKNQKSLFSNSEYNDLLIGDKHSVIMVEIGPSGYSIYSNPKKQSQAIPLTNGYLWHTNQYISKKLLKDNNPKRFFADSVFRYRRAEQLLKKYSKKGPLTYPETWLISNDRSHGAANSIFRNATVATWILTEPKAGNINLYMRFTDPNQKYNYYHLTLNNAFWKQGQTAVINYTQQFHEALSKRKQKNNLSD